MSLHRWLSSDFKPVSAHPQIRDYRRTPKTADIRRFRDSGIDVHKYAKHLSSLTAGRFAEVTYE